MTLKLKGKVEPFVEPSYGTGQEPGAASEG
jgi:hypothetical protein